MTPAYTPTLAPPVTLTRRVIITARIPMGDVSENADYEEAYAQANASIKWSESIEYLRMDQDGGHWLFEFAVIE